MQLLVVLIALAIEIDAVRRRPRETHGRERREHEHRALAIRKRLRRRVIRRRSPLRLEARALRQVQRRKSVILHIVLGRRLRKQARARIRIGLCELVWHIGAMRHRGTQSLDVLRRVLVITVPQ